MTPETALAELRADAEHRLTSDQAAAYLTQLTDWLGLLRRQLITVNRTPATPNGRK